MKEPSPYFIRRTAPLEPSVEPEPGTVYLHEDEGRIDLWAYWHTVRKHLHIVLAVFLAVVGMTVFHVYTEAPIYTASTTVMIDPQLTEGVDLTMALLQIEAQEQGSDFFKTQIAILKSATLAARVIRRLDLAHDPAFVGHSEPGLFARLRGRVTNQVGQLLAPGEGALHGAGQPPSSQRAAEVPQQVMGVPAWLVGMYLGALNVDLVGGTSLVTISFNSPDPQLAARIANAHAAEYIQQGIEIRTQASRQAQKFLQHKLVDLKDQLEKSEIALNDYRRARGIVPGLMSLSGKDTVVLDRLSDLSHDLTKAQVARIGLEAQVDLIRKRQYVSLPSVANNPMIQGLKTQLDALYAQEASMASQFTPEYPPLAQLHAKINMVKATMNREISVVVESIQGAYKQAVEQERELQAEEDRQRGVTLALNDAAVRYAILQRDVDTNRELYNAVLKRMKDVGVAAEEQEQTSDVSIIDRALPPGAPSSPKKGTDLMLSAVAGLGGGLGLVFLLDYLDNSLKDPEEMQRYLHLPNLGLVPEFARLNGSGYGPRSAYLPRELTSRIGFGRGAPQLEDSSSSSKRRELVTAHGTYSALGEAYRNLRTALLLSRAGSPPKLTLITSAVAGEGKTVTAVNTAAMLSQLSARVLLVDADLRRPRCHKLLTLDNHLGLTEVLTGVRELHELVRPTSVENLFLLGAGSLPPNATELLGSNKMRQVLNHVQQLYDYVVIDGPPVLPVSDAVVLSQMVDGVILVVAAHRTPKQQVRSACSRLDYARAKVFGTVLNKVKIRSGDYHYYYHYHQDYAPTNIEPEVERDDPI